MAKYTSPPKPAIKKGFQGKRRWYPGRDAKPMPPKFRLSGLLFDLFIDGTAHVEAERQIKAAAASATEATEAVRRFKALGGAR